MVTEMSYEAYRDIGKNPYSYETWGEGTSLKQKESQNPTCILNLLEMKKVFTPTLTLNYNKSKKVFDTLFQDV